MMTQDPPEGRETPGEEEAGSVVEDRPSVEDSSESLSEMSIEVTFDSKEELFEASDRPEVAVVVMSPESLMEQAPGLSTLRATELWTLMQWIAHTLADEFGIPEGKRPLVRARPVAIHEGTQQLEFEPRIHSFRVCLDLRYGDGLIGMALDLRFKATREMGKAVLPAAVREHSSEETAAGHEFLFRYERSEQLLDPDTGDIQDEALIEMEHFVRETARLASRLGVI